MKAQVNGTDCGAGLAHERREIEIEEAISCHAQDQTLAYKNRELPVAVTDPLGRMKVEKKAAPMIWSKRRRLNGDENAQGQLLRPPNEAAPAIFHVKLYRYR